MPTLRTVYRSPARMSTPRRLFTEGVPKMLFRTPRSSIRRGYGAKRRRVGTAKGATRRRPTVRDIVRDMAQEKKRKESEWEIEDVHQADAWLIGRDIKYDNATDTGSTTRSGNLLTFTGLSIKGHFRSIEPTNSVNTTRQAPVLLRLYLVSTTRQDNPLTYWWQGINSDINVPNDNITKDRVGDSERMERRMNKLDIKILGRATYRVVHPNFATTNDGHLKIINKYWKLNVPVHYNTDTAAAIPYGATNVRPNIWLVQMVLQPDQTATLSTSDVSGRIQMCLYFRE